MNSAYHTATLHMATVKADDSGSESNYWRAFLEGGEDAVKTECGFQSLKRLHKAEGGIVNKAAIYDTSRGKVFIKYSDRHNAESMFNSEMQSLRAIEATKTIRVPEPQKVVKHPQCGALFVMECMPDLQPVTTSWAKLGLKIAKLHEHNINLVKSVKKNENFIHYQHLPKPVTRFGFSHDTFYGPKFHTIPSWCDTWWEYMARFLLRPQFQEIEKRTNDQAFRDIWSELQLNLDKAYKDVDMIPSLTHGDFCTINVGEVDTEPVIFDPCSVYATSESDLTIPLMERNFDPAFYEAYHAVLPKQQGFELRMKVQFTFATTLVYNIPGYEHTRQEALDTARDLVQTLRRV